jgi:hypothetical protein
MFFIDRREQNPFQQLYCLKDVLKFNIFPVTYIPLPRWLINNSKFYSKIKIAFIWSRFPCCHYSDTLSQEQCELEIPIKRIEYIAIIGLNFKLL